MVSTFFFLWLHSFLVPSARKGAEATKVMRPGQGKRGGSKEGGAGGGEGKDRGSRLLFARWQVGGDHTGRRVTRRPGRRCLGPASPTPSAAEDPSARETFPAASTRTSRVSPILLIYSPPPNFFFYSVVPLSFSFEFLVCGFCLFVFSFAMGWRGLESSSWRRSGLLERV